jgi:hypothetical protein
MSRAPTASLVRCSMLSPMWRKPRFAARARDQKSPNARNAMAPAETMPRDARESQPAFVHPRGGMSSPPLFQRQPYAIAARNAAWRATANTVSAWYASSTSSLLRGINNDMPTMRALMHGLLHLRVRPSPAACTSASRSRRLSQSSSDRARCRSARELVGSRRSTRSRQVPRTRTDRPRLIVSTTARCGGSRPPSSRA